MNMEKKKKAEKKTASAETKFRVGVMKLALKSCFVCDARKISPLDEPATLFSTKEKGKKDAHITARVLACSHLLAVRQNT
jgi:hypothetical protein